MIRALVSIGTNSTRLLALDGERRVAAESRGTRLGAGIGASGTIDAQARARTLEAVDAYAAQARACGVTQIDCIATSALRRASDGAAFGDEVAARLGVAPRVIEGDQEAAYSFLGATAHDAGSLPVAVLDAGGGSTELALDVPAHARRTGRVAQTFSLEVGVVRLSDRHPDLLGAHGLDPGAAAQVERQARADAAAVLAPLGQVGGVQRLIAVGGTVFTAAGMRSGGRCHDGVRLRHDDRRALIAALLERDLPARKAMPHIRPQRADILPAGLIVVDEACRLLGVDELSVSEADLLLGYLSSPAYRAVPFTAGR